MSTAEITILTPLVARFLEGTHLQPSERAQVLHIAQGFAIKDSANADDLSTETIRSRRKRIYRKVGVSGAGELVSALLALSLQMLAKGERIEPSVATTEPDQGVTAPAMHVAASA
jgi:DNA-binding CsgD family transcriptional regulator